MTFTWFPPMAMRPIDCVKTIGTNCYSVLMIAESHYWFRRPIKQFRKTIFFLGGLTYLLKILNFDYEFIIASCEFYFYIALNTFVPLREIRTPTTYGCTSWLYAPCLSTVLKQKVTNRYFWW